MLKKYSALLRITITQNLINRAETLLWLILDIFPVLISIAIWSSIFQSHATIQGQTLPQLLTYFLMITFLSELVNTHFEENWIEEIRYGKIDFYFIKPLRFFSYVITRFLARQLFAFLLFLLPFSVTLGVIMKIYHLSFAIPSFIQLVLLLGFLLLGLCFNALLSFLIMLSAFWLEEANGITHFKWIIVQIFGGMIAPLTFYPKWLQTIAHYLPFQFVYAYPAMLFSTTHNPVSFYARGLLILGIFIGVLALLNIFVWKKAVRKYTSAGG